MGHLFQLITLDTTIILLTLTVYSSYSYCYTKISSEGDIYASYFVVLLCNMHFISFFPQIMKESMSLFMFLLHMKDKHTNYEA